MTDNNTNKPNDGMHISKVLTYAVVLKPNADAERKDEQAPARSDIRPSANQGS